MGRSPCCDERGVKKGPWTQEEDEKLIDYIKNNGHGSWRHLPRSAGLSRCGKSCRLRWTNYLRPDIKRGKFTEEEEGLIIHLHSMLGNKWSLISTKLPGRTDNEIKNYWNTHLKKKLLLMGIDPVTHRRRPDLELLANLPNSIGRVMANSWDVNGFQLQSDVAQLAQVQIMQSLLHVLMASSSSSSSSPSSSSSNGHQHLNLNTLLGSSLAPLRNVNNILEVNRQLEAFLNGLITPPVAGIPQMGFNYPPQDQKVGSETTIDGINVGKLQGMLNSNTIHEINAAAEATSSVPSLVPASPEINTTLFDHHISSNEISAADSGISPPFNDPWLNSDAQRLTTDSDAFDLGWEDILKQISW